MKAFDPNFTGVDNEGNAVDLKCTCPVCGLVFRGFNLGQDTRCNNCYMNGLEKPQ